ncbi:hypothetical protein K439DRAFT_239060 [Ramaria rubella]|nr:hypothetical protein K439DRAFT_239060 [Ramaria rubella]
MPKLALLGAAYRIVASATGIIRYSIRIHPTPGHSTPHLNHTRRLSPPAPHFPPFTATLSHRPAPPDQMHIHIQILLPSSSTACTNTVIAVHLPHIRKPATGIITSEPRVLTYSP